MPRNNNFKCYYCFQTSHSSNRCNILSYDETNGAVIREGRNFKLPDNTPIPWDITRPIKEVVDKHSEKKREVQFAALSSSFGQLEESSSQEVGVYEADLGKRTRSGKDYEETPATGKKNKKDQHSVMDIDEDIIKLANTPLSALDPGSKSFQPSKVKFQDLPQPPKEKPVKKTYLEKTLAKEYPGVEEETARKMLMEGKMVLSYGEIFAISGGVTDAFKKKITNKRIPIEENKSVNTVEMEEKEEEQDLITHYSCPLGYIKLSIKEHLHQALLDTGSMVNIIPEDLAFKIGLVITEKPMKLKGIGGHHTEIIGIAEGVEVLIGKITRPVHFWVARGPVQFIVGKPFLMDVSATIKYNGSRGESLSILDPGGQTYLVPIHLPNHHKCETSLPVNIATRDFLDQDQDYNFSK